MDLFRYQAFYKEQINYMHVWIFVYYCFLSRTETKETAVTANATWRVWGSAAFATNWVGQPAARLRHRQSPCVQYVYSREG